MVVEIHQNPWMAVEFNQVSLLQMVSPGPEY